MQLEIECLELVNIVWSCFFDVDRALSLAFDNWGTLWLALDSQDQRRGRERKFDLGPGRGRGGS